MKFAMTLLLQAFVLVSYAQLDMPSWLLPDTLGRYVAIDGQVFSQIDSLPTDGHISIIKHGNNGGLHRFSTKEDGSFKIFLPANGHFSVRFEKKDCIDKIIDIYTTNVPTRAWKSVYAIEIDAFMEKEPVGFNKSISKIPYNIVKYSPEDKFFIFDEEFEKLRREALDKEIQRCKEQKSLTGLKF